MESFVKLQPITSMKNVSGLRAMYDLVEGNVRNLSSLGVPSDTYGKLLVHLLIERISPSLRLVISCEFDDKVQDLENVLQYFKKGIFVKERRASLVNEKPYNPTSAMKIQWQHFYWDSKNCVVSIAKENISQKNVIR